MVSVIISEEEGNGAWRKGDDGERPLTQRLIREETFFFIQEGNFTRQIGLGKIYKDTVV